MIVGSYFSTKGVDQAILLFVYKLFNSKKKTLLRELLTWVLVPEDNSITMGNLTLNGQRSVRSAGQTPVWLLAYWVKRPVRLSYSLQACCLWWLSRSIEWRARRGHSLWVPDQIVFHKDHKMFQFAFVATRFIFINRFISDLTWFHGCLGSFSEWFDYFSHCAFMREFEFVCLPCFAGLLEKEITMIGQSNTLFQQQIIHEWVLPKWHSVNCEQKVPLCFIKWIPVVFFLLLWADCLLFFL